MCFEKVNPSPRSCDSNGVLLLAPTSDAVGESTDKLVSALGCGDMASGVSRVRYDPSEATLSASTSPLISCVMSSSAMA